MVADSDLSRVRENAQAVMEASADLPTKREVLHGLQASVLLAEEPALRSIPERAKSFDQLMEGVEVNFFDPRTQAVAQPASKFASSKEPEKLGRIDLPGLRELQEQACLGVEKAEPLAKELQGILHVDGTDTMVRLIEERKKQLDADNSAIEAGRAVAESERHFSAGGYVQQLCKDGAPLREKVRTIAPGKLDRFDELGDEIQKAVAPVSVFANAAKAIDDDAKARQKTQLSTLYAEVAAIAKRAASVDGVSRSPDDKSMAHENPVAPSVRKLQIFARDALEKSVAYTTDMSGYLDRAGAVSSIEDVLKTATDDQKRGRAAVPDGHPAQAPMVKFDNALAGVADAPEVAQTAPEQPARPGDGGAGGLGGKLRNLLRRGAPRDAKHR